MEFEPLVKQSKIQTDKTKQIITITAFDNINIGKKQLVLYVKNNKETKTTIDFDIIENEISSYLDHIPYSGQQTITLTTTNRIEEEYINQIILRKINTEIKPNKCQKDDDKILRCDFNFDINKEEEDAQEMEIYFTNICCQEIDTHKNLYLRKITLKTINPDIYKLNSENKEFSLTILPSINDASNLKIGLKNVNKKFNIIKSDDKYSITIQSDSSIPPDYYNLAIFDNEIDYSSELNLLLYQNELQLDRNEDYCFNSFKDKSLSCKIYLKNQILKQHITSIKLNDNLMSYELIIECEKYYMLILMSSFQEKNVFHISKIEDNEILNYIYM